MSRLDDIYGTDISCANDLDPAMRMVTAETLLGEAVFRRLTTPRGGLIDDPDYGFDVRSLLNKGTTATRRAAIPGQIRQEILKDERIDDATVKVEISDLTNLVLRIQCDAATGPFDLTVSVTEAEVLLLKGNSAGT